MSILKYNPVQVLFCSSLVCLALFLQVPLWGTVPIGGVPMAPEGPRTGGTIPPARPGPSVRQSMFGPWARSEGRTGGELQDSAKETFFPFPSGISLE